MAARTPRRYFATPFVVTLAAAPACYVQSAPAPQGPAPQQSGHPAKPAAVGVPTATQSPPPAQSPSEPAGSAPVIVNPPRPQQPPPATAQPSTPVAATTQKWTVYKAKDGCMAAVQVTCPPKTMCNPPPPFRYECPQNVSLDNAITVVQSADGATCQVEYPPVKCPPNTVCNPPRPTPVACPKR